MNQSQCENVMCAALARLDGELPPLSEKETLDHLANCQRCRDELAEITSVLQPLNKQKRREIEHDLWPAMEAIVASPAQPMSQTKYLIMFFLFGLFLLVAKIFELHPGIISGLIVKPLSILVTLLFFLLLKQNPFRIRADLAVSCTTPSFPKTTKEVSHVSSLP